MSAANADQLAGPGQIKDKVREATAEFWVCKTVQCRQIYWIGPKYADTRELICGFVHCIVPLEFIDILIKTSHIRSNYRR